MSAEPRRIAQVIKLKPEHLEEYKKIHKEVWPGVLAALKRAHIEDYSIYYEEESGLLFATMKYTGTDYEADMKAIADDPETQRWWQVTDGMQQSLIAGATGSASGPGWWKTLEEVFRFD